MTTVMNKWMMKRATIALCLGVAGAAWADGAGQVTTPADLAPAAARTLKDGIAAARKADPGAFAALAAVRGYKPEQYMTTRGRKPNLAPELAGLGKRGLWPMLEALTEGLPGVGAVSAAEQQAIEVGLLDAVGKLADPRAEAVLAVAFSKAGQPGHVVATAALGLGRLCSGELDGALTGKRGAFAAGAALRGVGECRRPTSIEKLTAAASARPLSDAEVQAAAEALGKLGGSWALDAEVAAGTRLRAEADVMKAAAGQALTALERSAGRRVATATARALRHARAMVSAKQP